MRRGKITVGRYSKKDRKHSNGGGPAGIHNARVVRPALHKP